MLLYAFKHYAHHAFEHSSRKTDQKDSPLDNKHFGHYLTSC